MVRIGIAGIGGRMGREILAVLQTDPGLQLAGGLVRPERISELAGSFDRNVSLYDALAELIGRDGDRADVMVEFTGPDGTLAIARECAALGCPLVSGTTGLSADQLVELQSIARTIPVFYSRNMSVGISALLASLPSLVQALDGYDIEIVETHHRHKADAPSGTALALAEAISTAVSRPLEHHAVYGRHGVAPRQLGDIGIHAVRAGGNAGEHTIVIANEGEEIRVSHRAFSRRTFAIGALRAARFLVQQPPGFYTMTDLLAGRPGPAGG
ncbi:MAG: 4-hydroxy-tetrahydrodipicolinate reductase [Thermomicrobiales bacterium]|nr:4-hydroxy-tetrahydrodipicolinate reductase [Thermomicrobiales bacterium]